ncbi:MAG TPA: NnrS family protein [Gemmataceae bacterium]|nr:NnrS family protein [Gemmataceae bacterium]
MTTSAAWIDESVQIPDLLRLAPEARAVLDRYGLRGCGGERGPAESLGFFARAHDVPIEQLLCEVRERLARRPEPSADTSGADGSARLADAIYRPFFKAGIAVVLTLGAVWGAYLLLRIALTGRFTSAGLHEVNAHGHAQIFGWVGLFVMGFAYQAFPRFKHTELAFPRLAWASLGLMLAGLVGRSIAEPLADAFPWAGPVAVASAWLEVAAIALFVWVILATWRAAGKGLAFYDYYVLSALGWFVVQAVAEAVYLAATLAAANREELLALVATWQGAIRDAQIHGFALLMILGVSQRLLHHVYGFPAPSRRLSLAALVCLNIAVAGEIAGLVLLRDADGAWAGLWYAAALLLTGTVVALLWNWRVFGQAAEADRSLKFLRAAYTWLLVSLAMLVLLPAYQFLVLPQVAPSSEAAALGFSHAYYGAIRHAITVGFISLMIVGVAARVVPTLNGVDIHRLTTLWVPFLLLNAGCTLRVVAQTLTDFTPHAFPLAGVSGLLEVSGLALWGVHLWAVMAGRARYCRSATPPYVPGTPIEVGHTVGEVLTHHPELLETFLALGFRPLANPLLRKLVARHVSIGQACRQLGREPAAVLAALNNACAAGTSKLPSLPIVSVS